MGRRRYKKASALTPSYVLARVTRVLLIEKSVLSRSALSRR